MRVKVYKSLDKPSSFLGIRGRFLVWAAGGFTLALIIAFSVARISNGLLGVLVFLPLLLLDYAVVMGLQGRMSERELDRYLCRGAIPAFIKVRPRPLRRIYQDLQSSTRNR